MSRDDGFDVADLSTGLLDDPKVRDLWRVLGDRDAMGQAVTVYVAVVLSSWRHGCRVTVAEALPIWLAADPDVVAALRRVRLIDRANRLPMASWRGWYEPAAARREASRDRWRRANDKRKGAATRLPRGDTRGTAATGRQAGPSVRQDGPSLLSDRTVSDVARAREDGGATSGMGSAAAAAGGYVATLAERRH